MRQVEFRVDDKKYLLTHDDILQAAQSAQPERINEFYVEIAGKRFPTTQLVRLASGARRVNPYNSLSAVAYAWYQGKRAEGAKEEAKMQARIALSRQLAAQAQEQFNGRMDIALLLGVEAIRVANTLEARKSLIDGLSNNPALKIFLHGHTDSVESVAWSPDGKILASGSWDKTIIMWEVYVDVPLWSAQACRIANRNFTQAEWQQYMGNTEPYHATCPELPIELEKGDKEQTANTTSKS